MSGIGEVAYTILLGWMRGLVDWIWSMVAGGGPGSVVQWFLSNWKLWLVVLIVGGLAVDWLMWVVRWRPYRLLLGRRLRHAPAAGAVMDGEMWDQGIGYYEPEIALDADPSEWTELTLSTLSEIDPDWAGGVMMEGEADLPYPESPYYSDVYEEPPKVAQAGGEGLGYWNETSDEIEADGFAGAVESPYYEDPDMEEEPEQPLEETWAEDRQVYDESIFMPPAPGVWEAYPEPAEGVYGDGAYEEVTCEENAYEEDVYDAEAYDVESYEEPTDTQETVVDDATGDVEGSNAMDAVIQDTSPQLYMRPGFWPGALPFSRMDEEIPENEPEEEREEESVIPQAVALAEDAGLTHAPRRRRRRLHEAEPIDWQDVPPPFFQPPAPLYMPQQNSSEDKRPHRLVSPASESAGRKREEKRHVLRTVTGKPAHRRGLFRLTMANDEPIAGLPPLDLTDPFLPAVKPGSPDFEPDEGEEF